MIALFDDVFAHGNLRNWATFTDTERARARHHAVVGVPLSPIRIVAAGRGPRVGRER